MRINPDTDEFELGISIDWIANQNLGKKIYKD